jgi:hypothetical protein
MSSLNSRLSRITINHQFIINYISPWDPLFSDLNRVYVSLLISMQQKTRTVTLSFQAESSLSCFITIHDALRSLYYLQFIRTGDMMFLLTKHQNVLITEQIRRLEFVHHWRIIETSSVRYVRTQHSPVLSIFHRGFKHKLQFKVDRHE